MTGFSNPIIGGGGTLVYPQISSPNFSIAGMTGWGILKSGSAYFYNITATGTITGATFTGTNFIINPSGAFFYSGTPAAGNLIASIASASGTDQFGNAYLATVFGQTPGGVNAVLANGALNVGSMAAATRVTVDGQVILNDTLVDSGAPGLELKSPQTASNSYADLLLSGASKDGTVLASIIARHAGAGAAANPFFTIAGNLAFGTTQAVLSTDASGYPIVTDNAGLAQNISGSKLANIAGTTVTTVTLTSLGFMTVPAGDVEAGSAYAIHASGAFTTGPSAPSSALFGVYWGGVGGTILASLSVPAAGLTINASGLGWAVDAEVDWISATQAETTLTLKWHTASGVAGSVQWFVVSNVSGLVTNSGTKNLSLGFTWGSVPASTSLVCDVERSGRLA